jgi:hypothetical protein
MTMAIFNLFMSFSDGSNSHTTKQLKLHVELLLGALHARKLAITQTSSNSTEEEQQSSDNHFPEVKIFPFVITVFQILST